MMAAVSTPETSVSFSHFCSISEDIFVILSFFHQFTFSRDLSLVSSLMQLIIYFPVFHVDVL
jgi:hypothetical protein